MIKPIINLPSPEGTDNIVTAEMVSERELLNIKTNQNPREIIIKKVRRAPKTAITKKRGNTPKHRVEMVHNPS